MELKYKNYILKKDNYCWELIELKSYEKLDKLGGVPTGETGIKEVSIGYYPLDISIILTKLASVITDVKDISTIEDYISEYNKTTQELKQFIIDVTNTKDSSNKE